MFRTHVFHVFWRLLFWVFFWTPFGPRFETLFEQHFRQDAHRGGQEVLKRGLERRVPFWVGFLNHFLNPTWVSNARGPFAYNTALLPHTSYYTPKRDPAKLSVPSLPKGDTALFYTISSWKMIAGCREWKIRASVAKSLNAPSIALPPSF